MHYFPELSHIGILNVRVTSSGHTEAIEKFWQVSEFSLNICNKHVVPDKNKCMYMSFHICLGHFILCQNALSDAGSFHCFFSESSGNHLGHSGQKLETKQGLCVDLVFCIRSTSMGRLEFHLIFPAVLEKSTVHCWSNGLLHLPALFLNPWGIFSCLLCYVYLP